MLARVDGVEITAGDVESLLWEWRGVDALQDLITYQSVRAEAARLRVDVSEKDVESTIDAFIPQFAKTLQPGVSVNAALAAEGMTRSRMYLRFRTQLLIQKIVEKDFVPAKLVKVSTLVFKASDAQATSLGDAIKRAESAAARLQKGETWDAVFSSLNTDPRAAGSKGLIGWRLLSAFPASVATELSTLKPGQFTKPAQTENGIQIFRLEAAGRDAKGKEFDEMKTTYMQAAQSQLLTRLHQESKIERLYPPPGP